MRNLILVGLTLLVSAAACDESPTDATEEAAVVGNVVSEDPVAYGPNAEVIVRMSDVSLQDVAAPVVSEQIVSGPGELPVPFLLLYDPEQIDPRNTYAVGARIEEGDRLLYINKTSFPVITQGNPTEVDVVVEEVN
jgi:putative lipoprotein